MNSNTHSLALAAPHDKVFGFLSNIENLPKWATLFCRELKRDSGGRYRVVTRRARFCSRSRHTLRPAPSTCSGVPTKPA